MNKSQTVLVIGLNIGCICGWGTALWLLTEKLTLEMELDTFVRLAAQAKASETAKLGAPYFLYATNDAGGISTIIATNNGVPVRPYPNRSIWDSLFVQVFNEKMSEILQR